MTPEAVYNLIKGTTDKCATVQSTSGSRLTEHECDSAELLIQALEDNKGIYSEIGAVQIYTGTTLTTCNNARGHSYKIEYPKAAGAPTTTTLPAQNGVPFDTVLKYFAAKDDRIFQLQSDMARLQADQLEKRIAGLETKKQTGFWEDPEKVGVFIEKMSPIAMGVISKFKGEQTNHIPGNRVAGPAVAPKSKLVFEDIAKKTQDEQHKIYEAKFQEVIKTIGCVDFIAVFDMILINPEKVMSLVYAINEKPEYLDMAVNFLAPSK